MEVTIRHEESFDYITIRDINDAAFGLPNEGILISMLRANPRFIPELSLVAEVNGKLVGHILFFPVQVIDGEFFYQSLALAPMSVIPEFQGKGVGGMLINRGLAIARSMDFKSVIVLGHKDYYPRFGFIPASRWGIKAPYDIPDEVFMALELVENGLANVSGVVEYPTEFDEVS